VNELTDTGFAPTDFGSTGFVKTRSNPSFVSATW
jgi:hypothetical protein